MKADSLQKAFPLGMRNIQRQVVLPFGKSVGIAYKSLRVRLVRSLITVLSLVLAVAFLCFVNVGSLIVNAVLASGSAEARQTLVQQGYEIEPGQARIDNTPKQKWIVALSLLVCVVGIVNSQLMAVTERFREIGTMKCLGALDRFIVRLFLLEAGMQGAIGSLAGALLGALIAVLNAWARLGHAYAFAFEIYPAAWAVLKAVLVGCVLSLVGVLYPALVAARMQPVEAMRVEQ